jgi:hypothetical protein
VPSCMRVPPETGAASSGQPLARWPAPRRRSAARRRPTPIEPARKAELTRRRRRDAAAPQRALAGDDASSCRVLRRPAARGVDSDVRGRRGVPVARTPGSRTGRAVPGRPRADAPSVGWPPRRPRGAARLTRARSRSRQPGADGVVVGPAPGERVLARVVSSRRRPTGEEAAARSGQRSAGGACVDVDQQAWTGCPTSRPRRGAHLAAGTPAPASRASSSSAGMSGERARAAR